ncbi:MAG: mechanosensitive ion channel [Verrucomicrobia bacterium]|nr:mechanosensitive ion channel [Verrucomicrobiota bacterium]MBU4291087.1 mechanosensitive ion channel [Verrucomicrobiota bacterium]MBU4429363.1 mechanosensitive ion channel [Verrucomicrobiota bacterium]MBU4498124.1 mechanosensitive ion channel [Verrucomicrobiota bacterium]MCG2680104.1 mechanosensitive ion channel [Kiritimatiellia bacterium]
MIKKYIAMTKTRISLLIVFVVLAVVFFWLDHIDVSFFKFSQDKTLADYLAFTAAVLAVYEICILAFTIKVRVHRGAPSEIPMVASLLRFGVGVMIVASFFHFMGKLSGSWVAVAPFVGLLLGWSLQAPISGLAAWILVTVKRPFRLGDRVLLPSLGLIGDVQQMGMMYTVLNQVGGTVGTEEATGRHILVPNAMLFSNVVINYTPQQADPFVLDEVVVRITYDSDWKIAERILMDAATEVTGEVIKETGHKPYIRSDLYDYGVYMRLRYMTLAMDRPRIVHEITRKIFDEFQGNPQVDFAIPFVYSYRMGIQGGRRADGDATTSNDTEATDIDVNLIIDSTGILGNPGTDQQVKEMAARIAKMGLLQAIVVERRLNGAYEVVAGHLRLQACKTLGWKTVPAIILDRKSADFPHCQHGIGKGGLSK